MEEYFRACLEILAGSLIHAARLRRDACRAAGVPRWVVWKGPKVPYNTTTNSTASVTDPAPGPRSTKPKRPMRKAVIPAWGSCWNGDGIVGVDLDKCVTAGEPAPAALGLLDRVGCKYIELSPSGTGLRGFGGDNITGRRGQLDGVNVELYASKRYLTVTETHFFRAARTLGSFSEVAHAIREATHRRAQKMT